VATCEKVSEAFLIPLLEARLLSFPFVIHGLHCDNSSEYINQRVAKLFNKLLIEGQSKSRSRHSSDNTEAENEQNIELLYLPSYRHELNPERVRRYFGDPTVA
jgi:hypothetical protein